MLPCFHKVAMELPFILWPCCIHAIRASPSMFIVQSIVVCTLHVSSPLCPSPYYPCTLNGRPFVAHQSIIMSITSLVSTPSLLTIPPFYEPGAPPPTLPIPIAQTEIGNIERPDKKLLTQEELGTGLPCRNTSKSITPSSLLTIPPFYESNTPPPTLPILIAHTEVDNIKRPIKLLAQEELGTGPASKSASNSTHRSPHM